MLVDLLLVGDRVPQQIGHLLLETKHRFACFLFRSDLLQAQHSFATAVDGFEKIALYFWVIWHLTVGSKVVNELPSESFKMLEGFIIQGDF